MITAIAISVFVVLSIIFYVMSKKEEKLEAGQAMPVGGLLLLCLSIGSIAIAAIILIIKLLLLL